MRKKIILFIIGLAITIAALLCTWDIDAKKSNILSQMNNIIYDINLRIFNKEVIPNDIVIVDIDEKSLQHEGRWPWSRNKVAELIKKLQKNNTAVIAIDVLFPEQEPNIANVFLNYAQKNQNFSPQLKDQLTSYTQIFDNDKIFAEALSASDIVLGVFFNNALHGSAGKHGKPILKSPDKLFVLKESNFIGNTPILADAVKYTGFTTTTKDQDGLIRRSPMLIEYNNFLYPSLSLEAVRAYLLVDKITLDTYDLGKRKIFLGIQLGDTYIPTDASGNILVNYVSVNFSFPHISATDILNDVALKHSLEGKIAIIGSSAVGIGDLHSTPFRAINYPGAEIHATIMASILNKDFISAPLWMTGIERIIIIIIGLATTILTMYLSAFGFILLIIGSMFVLFLFNGWLLFFQGLVCPHVILPYIQLLSLCIINNGYGYLFETRARKKLRDVYGQYISTAHIDEMLEHKDELTLSGTTKNMTMLFADVRNFTTISEKLDAKAVKQFLNTLFTPFTEIIFEYQGTIDKYVGDMIMAFWNDPLNDERHALHAVSAALKMQQKVKEIAGVFAQQNINSVNIRIGINTGMTHVGDMGSSYRKAYTVLGDAVNLASRLEGTNKIYGTAILVSQATKELCPEILFRFVDCVYVKGKTIPVNIYEPLCLIEQKTIELETELAQYAIAIDLYNAKNWPEAKTAFTKLTAQYPSVGIYAVYLGNIAQSEKQPSLTPG